MDKKIFTFKVRVELLDDKDYFKWVVRRLKCIRDIARWGSDFKTSWDDQSKVPGRKTDISSIVVVFKVNADLLCDKDYFKSVVRRLKFLRDAEKWRL